MPDRNYRPGDGRARRADYNDYYGRDIDRGWPYGDGDSEPSASDERQLDIGNGRSDARWDRDNGGFSIQDAEDVIGPQGLGDHRGKGPRSYRRADERIEDEVNERLSDDGGLDASEITVSVREGEVFLDGEVGSRWDKRRAEDIVLDISGVSHVQNNLRVASGG
jgi:hypothetical protein